MIIEAGLTDRAFSSLKVHDGDWIETMGKFNVLLSRSCSVSRGKENRNVSVVLDGYLSDCPIVDPELSVAEKMHRLYLEYGERALRLVDGAFIVAIVDEDRGVSFVANDRFGKKSGFFVRQKDRMIFAGSVQELSSFPGIELDPDNRAFFDILSLGCVPAPRSMFKGVEKISPASLWTISRKIEKSSYYDLSEIDVCSTQASDFSYEVRSLLLESVSRGAALSKSWSAFLSGGMDSSSVVWAMSKSVPALDTFYANFGSLDDYLAIPDEIGVARDVAHAVSSSHSELMIGPDAIARVPSIVSAIGEPICDGGPIVVDRVLASASSHSQGIMSGNGGDFLFGGERRHLLHMLIENRSLSALWSLAGMVGPHLPVLGSERLARLRFDLLRSLELRKLNIAEFYAHRFNTQDEIARLLGIECPEDEGGLRHVEKSLVNARHWDGLSQLLYLDLKLLSPNLILRDVNTLADHYGMTAYHPFFDWKFVEYAMRLPTSAKIRGLTLKYALRSAMDGCLPSSVLRKKKGGLGAPILYWLTSGDELVEDCLAASTVRSRGLFDPKEILRMRADTSSRRRDYSMLLWTAFTCELWMREFADGRPSANKHAGAIIQLDRAVNSSTCCEVRSAF